MNILIVGVGKIGYTLSEYLCAENHNITVIDTDRKALEKVQNNLDVKCIRGNGANMRTLLEAEAGNADVVIAATANDELNMVSCLEAKQLGAHYSIARIRDPEYTESMTLLQEKLDLDMVINPERTTAQEISRLLRLPFASDIESFAHGRVEMVEFRAEEGDPITDIPLMKLHRHYPYVQFTAVQRGNESFIPGGNFAIQPGDRVYVTGDRRQVTDFFRHIGKDTHRMKSAMLIGGGHISYYLARVLAGMGVRLRIVEIREDICRTLCDQLDDVDIICADGTDQDFLDSENVGDCGALVCLTNRDEENLVTGLYGARAGAKKVIVKVNRIKTLDLFDNMPIDSVVSTKYTTASEILRTVRALSHSRGSEIQKVYSMLGGKFEACAFTAPDEAPYLNIPLSDLGIKRGVLVSMIARGHQIIIPFGSDTIEAGDTVLLVSQAGRIMTLEDAFQKAETRR